MKRLQGRNAVFAAVGIAAVGIAVTLILVSVLGSGGKKASAETTSTPVATGTATPGKSPALPGAAATVALLKGIPQRLNQLGNPNASTTMVEFADLQCPYCRDYATDVLPTLVEKYARTGKVKFLFSGIHFLGPDSEKALRAVYAAGLQGRLWEVLNLLYSNQGAENEGWVTDGLLRSVGNSIPGFDTEKMLADMSSAEVDNAIAVADQQKLQAQVNQTPTFFAGRTGGTLQNIPLASLTPGAFIPTLDSLVQ